MYPANEVIGSFDILVDRIEERLGDEVNVLELAREFALSPWHFQRLFKSLVGDSLGSYIRGRRLTRAAQLLNQTDMGILDIAIELGYNSHEAFTRAFKTQFGMTPKELRQKKPPIQLQSKPVLDQQLLHFLSTRIDMAPQVTHMPAQRILGFQQLIDSPFVDPVHCTTIAEPWMKLLGNLEGRIELGPRRLVGITQSPSGDFTEAELTYVAGLVVAEDEVVFDHLPDGCVEVQIPAQKVAVFKLSSNVSNDNLKQKVDAIYGYWLLNAEAQRGNGDDYELFTNIRHAISGDFDAHYIIPLQN